MASKQAEQTPETRQLLETVLEGLAILVQG